MRQVAAPEVKAAELSKIHNIPIEYFNIDLVYKLRDILQNEKLTFSINGKGRILIKSRDCWQTQGKAAAYVDGIKVAYIRINAAGKQQIYTDSRYHIHHIDGNKNNDSSNNQVAIPISQHKAADGLSLLYNTGRISRAELIHRLGALGAKFPTHFNMEG